MINQPALLHTLPLQYLEKMGPQTNLYIEAEYCLKSLAYKNFFGGIDCGNSILDCGVGISADISVVNSGVTGDRDWAVKYFELGDIFGPGVVVSPDVLGCASATRRNFELYTEVSPLRTTWMYVIQGQTVAEAEQEIEWAAHTSSVKLVGFPRVVHYYGDPTDSEALGKVRVKFITKYIKQLYNNGKAVHILGMNNLDELRFAAELGMSIDSRIATLMAAAGLEIDTDYRLYRPKGLKVDMLRLHSVETLELIEQNIFVLNAFFDNYVRRDS